MTTPAIQSFVLALASAGGATQLITINVIVSREGGIHLDVRDSSSSGLVPLVNAASQNTSTAPPSQSFITPPGSSAIVPSSTATATQPPPITITAGTSTNTSGPPPPSYAEATAPSQPTPPATQAQTPQPTTILQTPPWLPISPTAAPPLDPSPPTTRIRRHATAQRRIAPRPRPRSEPMNMDGPGLLSTLVTMGLGMLEEQVKRPFWSVEADVGGRDAKRRRL
ncbi:hypothetical protein C8J57DRAFT_522222 [Mycena rebaudengoi]|nr:hypothetical protein C8J57DRAFT_522222 [Mycena rebaudengoi]